MTQLVKQRPLAVWSLFLAGAVTGGLASSLMEPQHVLAEPTDLSGQKFEQLERLVAAHDRLLDGISRDESGNFVFRDPLRAVELLVECAPDSDRPALSVCGTALFESPVLSSRVILNDQGPQYPEPDFAGPALQVVGPSLFTGDAGPDMPLVGIVPVIIHPGKPDLQVLRSGLSVVGTTGTACLHHDRFELLNPEAEVFSILGADDLGSFLEVRSILAESVTASSFQTKDPAPF